MKRHLKILGFILGLCITLPVALVGCGEGDGCKNKDITLATYTNTDKQIEVNNEGVTLECSGENEWTVSGTVAVASEKVISEFIVAFYHPVSKVLVRHKF